MTLFDASCSFTKVRRNKSTNAHFCPIANGLSITHLGNDREIGALHLVSVQMRMWLGVTEHRRSLPLKDGMPCS